MRRGKKIILTVFLFLSVTLFFVFYPLRSPIEKISESLKYFQVVPHIKQRAQRVKQFCKTLRNSNLVEWSALHNSDIINRATNVRFSVGENKFQLCMVLKSGSLSWKTFFKINSISHKYLKDEDEKQFWKKKTNRLSLIQVRHPFMRLLSAWRHIFQASGWRNLEMRFINNPELLRQGKNTKENLTNYTCCITT